MIRSWSNPQMQGNHGCCLTMLHVVCWQHRELVTLSPHDVQGSTVDLSKCVSSFCFSLTSLSHSLFFLCVCTFLKNWIILHRIFFKVRPTYIELIKPQQWNSVVSRWMDKQMVIYIWNGVLFSHEKYQSTDICYAWMSLENIILSERSQTQVSHIIWFLLYKISRIGKCMETEGKLVLSGAGVEGHGDWFLKGDGVGCSEAMEKFWN